jgi:hypothetical protein
VEEGRAWGVAFSPDAKTRAASYSSTVGLFGGVVLRDTATSKRLDGVPLPVDEGWVTNLAADDSQRNSAVCARELSCSPTLA